VPKAIKNQVESHKLGPVGLDFLAGPNPGAAPKGEGGAASLAEKAPNRSSKGADRRGAASRAGSGRSIVGAASLSAFAGPPCGAALSWFRAPLEPAERLFADFAPGPPGAFDAEAGEVAAGDGPLVAGGGLGLPPAALCEAPSLQLAAAPLFAED